MQSMEKLWHDTLGNIIKTSKCHKKWVEQQISTLGMYESQHRLLMYLKCNPNVSQTHLAKELNVSTPAVTMSLKKLEAEGYITRSIDEKDNRYNQVEITQKGRDMICQSIEIFKETDKIAFQGFSKEELEVLNHYLERVYENVSKRSEKN